MQPPLPLIHHLPQPQRRWRLQLLQLCAHWASQAGTQLSLCTDLRMALGHMEVHGAGEKGVKLGSKVPGTFRLFLSLESWSKGESGWPQP